MKKGRKDQLRLWVVDITCLIAFVVLQAFLVLLGLYSPNEPDDIFWTIAIAGPILLFGGLAVAFHVAEWWDARKAQLRKSTGKRGNAVAD